MGLSKTILADSIHNEGILTNDMPIKRMLCPNSQDEENIADASFCRGEITWTAWRNKWIEFLLDLIEQLAPSPLYELLLHFLQSRELPALAITCVAG